MEEHRTPKADACWFESSQGHLVRHNIGVLHLVATGCEAMMTRKVHYREGLPHPAKVTLFVPLA